MDVQPILNDVFGSSPLAHIERHSEACLNCVRMLKVYFEAAQAGDWELAEKTQAEIVRLEGIADDIKMEVRMNLPRGLWMSVSRADLLDLVRIQDAMATKQKILRGYHWADNWHFPASWIRG